MDSGFAPVARPDARVLILGTLPGQVSLQMGQYYAQPRNTFWKIMGELVGAYPGLSYEERLQRLLEARIALWDVCEAASRPGSLDASIEGATVVVNDFQEFLEAHSAIQMVYFNGAKAEALYRRRVLAKSEHARGLPRITLPSTSPANAALAFEAKLSRWRVVLDLRSPGDPRVGAL